VKYESRFERFRLAGQGWAIQFHKGNEPGGRAGQFYGEFDTAGTDLALSGFETEAQAMAAIEASEAFKSGQVWRRTDRLEHEAGEKKGAACLSVVADMNEAQLRAVIVASNVACPGAGAELADLQRIAADCLSGRAQPESVPEVEPQTSAPEPEPEAEPKTPKRRKQS
jgi:hypothetical protein